MVENYKQYKTNKNMQDTLYNVLLTLGNERINGLVKAETLPKALEYLSREYPNYTVEEIEKSWRILL